MIKNRGYAICIGIIGIIMISGGINSLENNSKSVNDQLIVYCGVLFLVVAITSFFFNGSSSLEIRLATYMGRFLGLAYLVGGTALIIDGSKSNDNQLLCWGALFIIVGSTPFHYLIYNGWQNLKRKIKSKQLIE